MSILQIYMKQQWNDIDRENQRTWRKTNPSATLSTTNSTWTDLGTNLGLFGEKLVTNHLVYGTTYMNLIKHVSIKSFGPQNNFFK
jgi:hypothetical protein